MWHVNTRQAPSRLDATTDEHVLRERTLGGDSQEGGHPAVSGHHRMLGTDLGFRLGGFLSFENPISDRVPDAVFRLTNEVAAAVALLHQPFPLEYFESVSERGNADEVSRG